MHQKVTADAEKEPLNRTSYFVQPLKLAAAGRLRAFAFQVVRIDPRLHITGVGTNSDVAGAETLGPTLAGEINNHKPQLDSPT